MALRWTPRKLKQLLNRAPQPTFMMSEPFWDLRTSTDGSLSLTLRWWHRSFGWPRNQYPSNGMRIAKKPFKNSSTGSPPLQSYDTSTPTWKSSWKQTLLITFRQGSFLNTTRMESFTQSPFTQRNILQQNATTRSTIRNLWLSFDASKSGEPSWNQHLTLWKYCRITKTSNTSCPPSY